MTEIYIQVECAHLLRSWMVEHCWHGLVPPLQNRQLYIRLQLPDQSFLSVLLPVLLLEPVAYLNKGKNHA